MSPWEFAAFMACVALATCAQSITGFAMALILLGLTSLVGAFSFASIGLLAASRARTVEGLSGLLNLIILPMWVLSGVFFASTNFPAAMQPFIQALPLTALNDALRALMLEGTGAGGLAGELALLAGWGGLTFLTALRVFRWS